MEYPEFLKCAAMRLAFDCHLSREREKVLSNWLVLNDHFQTQPNSDELMELMTVELSREEPRTHILEKIHGRLKETRHKEERAQLEFPEE